MRMFLLHQLTILRVIQGHELTVDLQTRSVSFKLGINCATHHLRSIVDEIQVYSWKTEETKWQNAQ